MSMWLHVHVTCGTCGGEVSTDLAGLLCQVLEHTLTVCCFSQEYQKLTALIKEMSYNS